MFLKLQWERPVECRLCQCPVADTGVRMDKLDPEKLSEWWKQKLDAELKQADVARGWICQFCVWDARLEHEYTVMNENNALIGNNAPCEWWSGFDTNVFFYTNYFKDAVVERCSVNAALEEQFVDKSLGTIGSKSRNATLPTECKYCHQMFRSKSAAETHAMSNHRDAKNKCLKCKLYFRNALALNVHLDKVHKKTRRLHAHAKEMHSPVHMCKYRLCIKVFKTEIEKLKHEREDHEIKGVFKCFYCDEQDYLTIQALKRHLQSKHKDKSLRCDCTKWCKRFFLTEAEKTEHVKIAHKSCAAEIECEVCSKKLLRPHLNAHMRQFHARSNTGTNNEDDTVCCYCKNTFPSRKSAFKHVKEAHSNIETFKCFECQILFENVEMKRDHYQLVHRGNFRCIYCKNWACTNRMNLRRHMREKHQGEVIQCKYSNKCGLYFKTQAQLQQHISKSHEADNTNKLQCIYCNKYLPFNHFNRHINTHHKSVAIKCDFFKRCCFFFLTEEDRQEHILEVHQPGVSYKKLKCPCCTQVFVDFTRMKIHAMKNHSKNILKCSVKLCKFLCTNDQTIEIHIRKRHSEVKNSSKLYCSNCNFFSYRKAGIQEHLQRQHGTENLKCHYCPEKNFNSKFSIQIHVQLQHIYRICRHCKTRLSVAALKKHRSVHHCRFCKIASPCGYHHRRHERICELRKFSS